MIIGSLCKFFTMVNDVGQDQIKITRKRIKNPYRRGMRKEAEIPIREG